MKKKRKAREIWMIDNPKDAISGGNGLMTGVSFHSKEWADETNKWANGKPVKFREVM